MAEVVGMKSLYKRRGRLQSRGTYTEQEALYKQNLVGAGANEQPDSATSRRPTRYAKRPEAKRAFTKVPAPTHHSAKRRSNLTDYTTKR